MKIIAGCGCGREIGPTDQFELSGFDEIIGHRSHQLLDAADAIADLIRAIDNSSLQIRAMPSQQL